MNDDLIKWLAAVRQVAAEKPEWTAATLAAWQSGLTSRIELESRQRADAEAALIVCYESARASLPEHQRELVRRAVKECALTRGTDFSRSV